MNRAALNRAPEPAPVPEIAWSPGPHPAPHVVAGPSLMFDLAADPHGTLEALRARHGDLFVLRAPGLPPVTALAGPCVVETVRTLTQDGEGPGLPGERTAPFTRWAPAATQRSTHLESLRAVGRRHLAARLREQGHDVLDAVVRPLVDTRVRARSEPVDLAALVTDITREAAGRLALGTVWSAALGDVTLGHLGAWAGGVDVARALLAGAPLGPLLPERRAGAALSRRILRLARAPESSAHAAVHAARRLTLRGGPATPEDVTWLLEHALWCTTVMPGAYAAWCLADVLSDPETHTRARRAYVGRTALLEGAVLETIRLAPSVCAVLDHPDAGRMRHGDRVFDVPAGRLLVVPDTSGDRDLRSFPDPDTWRPERYVTGAPTPHLFGSGPFVRVVGHWTKRLVASVLTALFDKVDVRVTGPLPDRTSRRRLLPRDVALRGVLTPR